MTDNRTTELQSLSKLKMAGKLRYWRGTIEMPEAELHAICDEIQAEHEQAIAATLGSGTLTAEQVSMATYAHSIHADCADADWQAIADELNAELGSGTRWHKLFGTPKRAARTLIAVRGVCESGPCSPNCPFSGAPVCPSSFEPSDYDALLEWLKEDG